MHPFEDFWALYPKHVGRKPAMKIWIRLSPTTQQTILDDLPKRVKGRKWADKTYIEHPTTYLNQERWDDEIEDHEDTIQVYTL
jgi:hypothetical protein